MNIIFFLYLCLGLLLYTKENTEISPDFVVQNFVETHGFRRVSNFAFSKNFHINKLSEIHLFYPMLRLVIEKRFPLEFTITLAVII